MEWQTIKSVWVSYRVRSQFGAEWHTSLALTNHSLAGTQRSSHTTWTIFRQVASFGFAFTVFAKYFANYTAAFFFFMTEQPRLVTCFLKGNSDLNIKWGSSYARIPDATSGCWCSRGIIHHGALHGGDRLPSPDAATFYISFSRDVSGAECILVWNERQGSIRINGLRFQRNSGSYKSLVDFPVIEENRFQLRLWCEWLITYSKLPFLHIHGLKITLKLNSRLRRDADLMGNTWVTCTHSPLLPCVMLAEKLRYIFRYRSINSIERVLETGVL